MKVVLATNNDGKIREFRHLLADFPIELIPQAELNVTEINETGLSFVENAILKARHATKHTGFPAIADDSGLTVDALKGSPGIFSARYAGPEANANDNINKLLKELTNIPLEQRQAHFHCVLVFMTHELDPVPLICHGTWSGLIIDNPTGKRGFGYDPVFFVPSEQQTAAEFSLEKKNKLSHRGLAMQILLKMLPEKLCQLSLSKN